MCSARVFNSFQSANKQDGIEIALHGAAMFQVAPAYVQRNAPVEADDFGSGFIHRGQERGAVGAEINDGRAGFLQIA